MYPNRRHVKDREIKLRVDDATYELIAAMAQYHRTQKAALVRELVESQLARFADEHNSTQTAA